VLFKDIQIGGTYYYGDTLVVVAELHPKGKDGRKDNRVDFLHPVLGLRRNAEPSNLDTAKTRRERQEREANDIAHVAETADRLRGRLPEGCQLDRPTSHGAWLRMTADAANQLLSIVAGRQLPPRPRLDARARLVRDSALFVSSLPKKHASHPLHPAVIDPIGGEPVAASVRISRLAMIDLIAALDAFSADDGGEDPDPLAELFGC